MVDKPLDSCLATPQAPKSLPPVRATRRLESLGETQFSKTLSPLVNSAHGSTAALKCDPNPSMSVVGTATTPSSDVPTGFIVFDFAKASSRWSTVGVNGLRLLNLLSQLSSLKRLADSSEISSQNSNVLTLLNKTSLMHACKAFVLSFYVEVEQHAWLEIRNLSLGMTAYTTLSDTSGWQTAVMKCLEFLKESRSRWIAVCEADTVLLGTVNYQLLQLLAVDAMSAAKTACRVLLESVTEALGQICSALQSNVIVTAGDLSVQESWLSCFSLYKHLYDSHQDWMQHTPATCVGLARSIVISKLYSYIPAKLGNASVTDKGVLSQPKQPELLPPRILLILQLQAAASVCSRGNLPTHERCKIWLKNIVKALEVSSESSVDSNVPVVWNMLREQVASATRVWGVLDRKDATTDRRQRIGAAAPIVLFQPHCEVPRKSACLAADATSFATALAKSAGSRQFELPSLGQVDACLTLYAYSYYIVQLRNYSCSSIACCNYACEPLCTVQPGENKTCAFPIVASSSSSVPNSFQPEAQMSTSGWFASMQQVQLGLKQPFRTLQNNVLCGTPSYAALFLLSKLHKELLMLAQMHGAEAKQHTVSNCCCSSTTETAACRLELLRLAVPASQALVCRLGHMVHLYPAALTMKDLCVAHSDGLLLATGIHQLLTAAYQLSQASWPKWLTSLMCQLYGPYDQAQGTGTPKVVTPCASSSAALPHSSGAAPSAPGPASVAQAALSLANIPKKASFWSRSLRKIQPVESEPGNSITKDAELDGRKDSANGIKSMTRSATRTGTMRGRKLSDSGPLTPSLEGLMAGSMTSEHSPLLPDLAQRALSQTVTSDPAPKQSSSGRVVFCSANEYQLFNQLRSLAVDLHYIVSQITAVLIAEFQSVVRKCWKSRPSDCFQLKTLPVKPTPGTEEVVAKLLDPLSQVLNGVDHRSQTVLMSAAIHAALAELESVLNSCARRSRQVASSAYVGPQVQLDLDVLRQKAEACDALQAEARASVTAGTRLGAPRPSLLEQTSFTAHAPKVSVKSLTSASFKKLETLADNWLTQPRSRMSRQVL